MPSPNEICVQIEGRIKELTDEMVRKYYKEIPERKDMTPDYLKFEVVKGVKYYKIILCTPGTPSQYSRSVHAFVHRQTGSVYKPASWRAPAKHVRYNLLDEASFQACLQACEWAGGYLYLK